MYEREDAESREMLSPYVAGQLHSWMSLVQEQQLEVFGFMVKAIGRVLQRYARGWTSGK